MNATADYLNSPGRERTRIAGFVNECLLVGIIVLTLFSGAVLAGRAADSGKETPGQRDSSEPGHWITADHSKFAPLQKDFRSGAEVTAACLSCHNQAGAQVRETIHWTWICPADSSGKMGKNGLTLNNF